MEGSEDNLLSSQTCCCGWLNWAGTPPTHCCWFGYLKIMERYVCLTGRRTGQPGQTLLAVLNRFMQTHSFLTTGSFSLRSHYLSRHDDNNPHDPGRYAFGNEAVVCWCALIGRELHQQLLAIISWECLWEMAYGALNRYLQQVWC